MRLVLELVLFAGLVAVSLVNSVQNGVILQQQSLIREMYASCSR